MGELQWTAGPVDEFVLEVIRARLRRPDVADPADGRGEPGGARRGGRGAQAPNSSASCPRWHGVRAG